MRYRIMWLDPIQVERELRQIALRKRRRMRFRAFLRRLVRRGEPW